MKIKIGLDISLWILASTVHDSNGFPHGGEFRLLDSRCGQRGDFGLENRANFGQMIGPFRLPNLYHKVKGLPHGLRRAIGDECSFSRVSLYESFFAKRLHGFAHRGATHAEPLRQFALGGKLITGFQIAFNDGFFDLLNDLLVEP